MPPVVNISALNAKISKQYCHQNVCFFIFISHSLKFFLLWECLFSYWTINLNCKSKIKIFKWHSYIWKMVTDFFFLFNKVISELLRHERCIVLHTWMDCVYLLADISQIFFFRHSAALNHPSYAVSVLLGELPMASGSSGMQDVLHSPPSVLCHHKLGYHDLQHRALYSYLPCHVVRLQSEGKGTLNR